MSSAITLSIWQVSAGVAGTAAVAAGVTLWFIRSSVKDYRRLTAEMRRWSNRAESWLEGHRDEFNLTREQTTSTTAPTRVRRRLRRGDPRERFTKGWGQSDPEVAARMVPLAAEPIKATLTVSDGTETTQIIETAEGRPVATVKRNRVEPITDYPGRSEDDDDTPSSPPAIVAHKPDWRTDPTRERPAINVEMVAAMLAATLRRQVTVRLPEPTPTPASIERYRPRHAVAA